MSNVIYDPVLAAAYLTSDHPLDQVMYESLMWQLGIIKGKTVLDLGCGGGRSSRFLAQAGAIVTGVDIAEDMLNEAVAEERENPLGIRYLQGDARTLDLQERFDIVVPSFLLHYAQTKEELAAFCRSIYIHLRPGGSIVAQNLSPDPIVPWVLRNSHWTAWVDQSRAYQEGARVRLHRIGVNGEENCTFECWYWSKATYLELLQQAGFSHIQWCDHPFPESLKAQFPQWEQLANKNASCILRARRT